MGSSSPASPPLNPVERRLIALCGQWQSFRDQHSKRLLIWNVSSGALRLIEAFFEAQKRESTCATRDLFIVFDAPFEDSIQYAKDLKDALRGHYDASHQELKQQGITPDWGASATAFPDSAAGFIEMMRSFGSKHHQDIGHLVAVLMPGAVTSDAALAAWVGRCLSSGLPERLRLLAINRTDAPHFGALADPGHELVEVGSPELDMVAVARECFAHEAAVGPAALFRSQLIDLATLVEKGSIAEVQKRARDAFALARENHWRDQQVVVQMLMAGAFLKARQFDDALNAYRAARESAKAAQHDGHPAGGQLILQTWFGEAGTWLAQGQREKAAQCYDEAALVAHAIQQIILVVEALRMAAFCYAGTRRRKLALERGHEALTQAQRLKPEARPMTTLPLAGIELLRLIEPRRVKSIEQIARTRTATIAEARGLAESRAAQLASPDDASRLHIVHQELTETLQAATVEAAQSLDEIGLREGEPPFCAAYTRLRALLESQWPDVLFETLAKLSPTRRSAGSGRSNA